MLVRLLANYKSFTQHTIVIVNAIKLDMLCMYVCLLAFFCSCMALLLPGINGLARYHDTLAIPSLL